MLNKVENQTEILSDLLKQVADLVPGRRSMYLVGGAVRDYLINKPIYDWDFIMDGDVRPISKKVADFFRGAYFLLDEERNVARVIITWHGEKMVFDFAPFRAESLNGDLEKRDFTINAMAMSIYEPGLLIDPLGGNIDLQNRTLRYCHPDSFKDDPARVMRGIRLSLSLELNIDNDTRLALRGAVPLLTSVSIERRRDELFKIFNLGNTQNAVMLLDENGILGQLIPELELTKGLLQSPPHMYDVWMHTLSTLKFLDLLLGGLVINQPQLSINGDIFLSIDPLLKYRTQLIQRFGEELSPGRSRRALLLFSGLCHGLGNPHRLMKDEFERIRFLGHEQTGSEITSLVAARMALSNDEINSANVVVEQHMRIHSLASQDHFPDRRAIHRYFRHTGDQGIDICFLSLADSLATWGGNIPQKLWSKELTICYKMIETWFDKKQEIIDPPKLLSGSEIIKILQIEPGPKVGKAVLALKEAQGAGEVLTVQDAVNYIKGWYRKQVEGEVYDDISSN